MNAVEKLALRAIGENLDSPDVFSEGSTGLAQIRRSCGEAIQELCMLTGTFTRNYHLALREGRQFYRLSPLGDFFGWVIEAWDRTQGRRLIQVDLAAIAAYDPAWMRGYGPPTHYLQIGLDVLGVYRMPSADGTVLELKIASIPKMYATDTDPIRVREQYQRAAAHMAVSEYYASRGDATRAAEYLERYLEVAGLMTLRPETDRLYQMGGDHWKRGKP